MPNAAGTEHEDPVSSVGGRRPSREGAPGIGNEAMERDVGEEPVAALVGDPGQNRLGGGVLHIAAHGSFRPGHPVFSGVRLGETGRPDVGKVARGGAANRVRSRRQTSSSVR